MNTDEMLEAVASQYREHGFAGPVDVLSVHEVADLRTYVEQLERHAGCPLMRRFHWKAHLPFPALWNVIAHPNLCRVAERIIGPDILCWGSTFFEKEPNDNFVVAPHQDTTYYDLEPCETLTLWLAISDASVEAGCMSFMPGSHQKGIFRYTEQQRSDSLLGRGQYSSGFDATCAVSVPLRAGQASLHHENVLHASGPNTSTDRRIGLSIHYVAPHVRHRSDRMARAVLVQGTDRYGYWVPEQPPVRDFDPDAMEELDRVIARMVRPPSGR